MGEGEGEGEGEVGEGSKIHRQGNYVHAIYRQYSS